MIIALDVDGVVADLHVEWLRRINTQESRNLVVADVTSWDFLSPWLSYLHDSDLYDQVSTTLDAVDGVARLRGAGHRVFFATSCVKGMVDQKIDWLKRFRFIDRRSFNNPDVVCVSDKSLIRADVLVDDGLHNLDAFEGQWKIIFDQPWNRRGGENHYRAFGWDDVVRLITMMNEVPIDVPSATGVTGERGG